MGRGSERSAAVVCLAVATLLGVSLCGGPEEDDSAGAEEVGSDPYGMPPKPNKPDNTSIGLEGCADALSGPLADSIVEGREAD